jgi:ribosomal 50S subunit-recycling heat shock protein
MSEIRLVAQHALERSLARPAVASDRVKAQVHRASPRKPSGTRRSGAEIEAICERLCERVRVRPGASMVTFASELGTTVRALERPMAKLKAEGRVRSVGQRHLTSYFPAVPRAASGKD